jgi:ribosomal protein S18 acetylase RimI-like enzyme
MTISAVCTAELDDAFGLLYGPGTEDLPGRVAHAFRLVARGELDATNLLVARHNGAIVGAVFCQALPGAVAVIWPPQAAGDDPSVEDALTAAALRHVAGVKAVQAFLPPEEAGRAGPLVRAGFRLAARVWQMRREKPAAPARPAIRGVRLVPYPDCDPAEFLQILMRSHDDSLDCPELHGARTPEEVLAGYRDCAPDPARWWLARDGADPVGVLILGADELSFVGVVPDRRGRGVGRALVEAAGSVGSVTVDSRNAPAVQLYRSVGFAVAGARDVYLALPSLPAGAVGKNPIPF